MATDTSFWLSYHSPESDRDSGKGLRRSSTGRLVSVPWGRRCRWMSLPAQGLTCGLYNVTRAVLGWACPLVMRFARRLWRFSKRRPQYGLTLATALPLWWSFARLDPWVFPLVWGAIGIGLGWLWIILPLWEAPAPGRQP